MEVDKHIFQSLQQDSAEIYQEPAALRDALNIRITDRDNPTQFSITTEKGANLVSSSMTGNYIGHCKITDNMAIVFTQDTATYIYKVEYINEKYNEEIIAQIASPILDGDVGLKTLFVYENEKTQKVYWVQPTRPPRVINISKYIETPDSKITNTSIFDFVPELQLNETLNIEKTYGGGVFSPGVIQYGITYYNLYGQESNLAIVSPLYYISDIDKAGDPSKRYSNSFKITIENIDTNFDFVRIYSIHRTSLNQTPSVHIVKDLKITESSATVTDNGDYQETIDPTLLLYIGGKEFYAGAITQKDNTLFLGNLTLPSKDLKFMQLFKDKQEIQEGDRRQGEKQKFSVNQYYYKIQNLNKEYSGIFKYNQKYRIGIQGQYKDGTWSVPVYMGDIIINQIYPVVSLDYTQGQLMITTGTAEIQLGIANFQKELYDLGIRKLRAVVVYPKFADKRSLAQGVLCPTVFNYYGRMTNAPFAQSSWFFRPVYNKKYEGSALYGEKRGDYIQFNNFDVLNKEEIGNTTPTNEIPKFADNKYNSQFYIDENIVTFNSPDLSYNEDLWSIDYTGYELQIIGAVPLNSIYGNVNIETKSPAKSPSGGFVFKPVGYINNPNSVFDINGGAVGGSWWRDYAVIEKDDKVITSKYNESWLVSTWQRTGSLNNDSNHDKGDAQSSILLKKQISNIKVFNSAEISPNILTYNPKDIQLVMNYGEQTINYLDLPYLQQSVQYQGNVDTLLTASEEYYIGSNTDTDSGFSGPLYSSSPVRMKYLSSPHLVISLPNDCVEVTDDKENKSKEAYATLLPRVKFYEDFSGDKEYTLPDWYYKYSGNQIDPEGDYTGDSGYKTMEIQYIGVYIDSTYMSNITGWVISQKPKESNTAYNTWAICRLNNGVLQENNNIETKTGYIPDQVNNAPPLFKIQPDCTLCFPASDLSLNISPETPSNDDIKQAIIAIFENEPDYFGINIKITVNAESLGAIERDVANNYVYAKLNHIEANGKLYGFVQKELTTFPFKPEEDEEGEVWANSKIVGCKLSEAPVDSNGTITTPTQDTNQKPETFKFKRDLLWKEVEAEEELPEPFKHSLSNTDFKKPAPYLLLAELVRKGADDEESDYNKNLFGGVSEQALNNNMWVPAGKAVRIQRSYTEPQALSIEYGDCFFGRYDCLKTYAANLDDENQVVEIGSFFCESWINFDGRYDNRIGMLTNWTTNNTNFNKINPVYSQKDNFFNYNKLPDEFYSQNSFHNQITWSLTKSSGADTDVWTNISLANTLNVDGANGPITDLFSLGDNIFCLQNNALNQILYNDRVQIQSSDGVPIEIANSDKVSGIRIINNTIGMQNPFGICKGKEMVYFIDGNNSGLYGFNGQQVQDLSTPNKMFQWHKNNNLSAIWTPKYKPTVSGIRLAYDYRYNDVYYLPNDTRSALNYSALLGTYISKYSLNGILGTECLGGKLVGFRGEENPADSDVYELFNGDTYLGDDTSSISFISTDKSDIVKIFDTLDIDGGVYYNNKEFYDDENLCPIKEVTVTNDYQEAKGDNFKKKFRLWRTQLPRVGRQRIRNPWTEISLKLNNTKTAKINSITVHYTK